MTTLIETFLPANTYEEALSRACQLWGVQEEFWDIFGKRHIATTGVKRAVLTSMGVAAETVESLNAAIEERSWQEWSRVVQPTLVIDAASGKIPLQVPAHKEHGPI